MQMDQIINSAKYQYEIVYSISRDTLVNEADKGFIPAKKLTTKKSKIANLMWGRKALNVEHRYKTEMMYDLVLEGLMVNNVMPWYDAYHNCWIGKDYSNLKNLRGLDIIC
jgi:hypothetical protein